MEGTAAERAGLGQGDGAAGAPAKEKPTTYLGADGRIESMMGAVRALQTAVRTRLGLPSYKNNGEKEPCAWRALAGTCSKQGCGSCRSKVPMPEDLIAEVRAKCKASIFGQQERATTSGSG